MIKWPLAKAHDGAYVYIKDAVRGRFYSCPECSTRFVARQGGKVRWHFAHYPGGVCTGEGSRHAIAKHYIASVLVQGLLTLPLRCSCDYPTKPYTVKVADVLVEAAVGEYRADIVCTIAGHPFCIEVVDTHSPEEERTNSLGDVGYQTLVVNIDNLTDEEVYNGERVEGRLLLSLGLVLPDLWPKHYFFHVWEHYCWRCGTAITVAVWCDQGGMWMENIPSLLLAEMRKYTKMELRTSWAGGPSLTYFANICPWCNVLQGDYYLMDEFLEMEDEERKRVTTVFVGAEAVESMAA